MRTASETRQYALRALGNNQYWPVAGSRCFMSLLMGVGTGLAFFLGIALAIGFCLICFGPMADFLDPGSLEDLVFGAMDRFGPVMFMVYFFVAGMVVAHAVILPVLYLVGFFTWGTISQDLAVLRGEARLEQVFSGWGHGWRMAWIMVVRQTYVFFWTLLLVVPGIVKSFSYAMTDFLAVEHPDWSAEMCINESCRLMEGNRWRYFCLNFSFIGWWLVVLIVRAFGVPFTECFLQPYVEAAQVAFYDELKRMRPQTDFPA